LSVVAGVPDRGATPSDGLQVRMARQRPVV